MNKIFRTYIFMIVGAISGLIGWQASNLIGLSIAPNVYLAEIPVGAVIGLTFGVLLGAIEGMLTRHWVKILKGLLVGAVIGLLAGAIALPLSEWLFQTVGAGIFGRAIGWGFFGMVIGLAAGITSGAQLWKGMLGGLLGGVGGGSLDGGVRSAVFRFTTGQGTRDDPAGCLHRYIHLLDRGPACTCLAGSEIRKDERN